MRDQANAGGEKCHHDHQPEWIIRPNAQVEQVCRRAELLSPSRVDQQVAIVMATEEQ